MEVNSTYPICPDHQVSSFADTVIAAVVAFSLATDLNDSARELCRDPVSAIDGLRSASARGNTLSSAAAGAGEAALEVGRPWTARQGLAFHVRFCARGKSGLRSRSDFDSISKLRESTKDLQRYDTYQRPVCVVPLQVSVQLQVPPLPQDFLVQHLMSFGSPGQAPVM